jgi:hypothetical protein
MYTMSVVVPTVVSSGNQVFTRLQDLNHPSLVSLGGGARRANNYLIDGVSHSDLVNRPTVNPSFEAIESVNVQLHTYDAETGRTRGGTYNVTAKSGGNIFRGSGFYPDRPSALVANNFFTKAAGQRSRAATSTMAAAVRADRSCATERSSGTRLKAIRRWILGAARSGCRPRGNARVTSPKPSTARAN